MSGNCLKEAILLNNLFAKTAKARSKIYKFLSRCFTEPSIEFTREVIDRSHFLILKDFSEKFTYNSGKEYKKPHEINSGFDILNDYVSEISEFDIQEVYTDLSTEFVRLFLIPYYSRSTFPYESVYRTNKKLVMGEPAVEVWKVYEEAGFGISENYTDLPDHIGLELEFMFCVCEKEAQSWKNGQKTAALKWLRIQSEFLNQHLIHWIPNFCDDVFDTTTHDFYRAISLISKGHLILDKNQTESFYFNLFSKNSSKKPTIVP